MLWTLFMVLLIFWLLGRNGRIAGCSSTCSLWSRIAEPVPALAVARLPRR